MELDEPVQLCYLKLILMVLEHLHKHKRQYILSFFLRNNYNMLLIPQLEPFSSSTPKHFVHGEVSIQL